MPDTTQTADIGLIGLAVMGQNLVLNIADHGYKVAVYNRTTQTMTDWIAKVQKEEPAAPRVAGYAELKDFVAAIQRPRKVIILVKAGKPVDDVIAQLLPLMEQGDIIIDGGNSQWTDTIRREKELAPKGFHFVGSGVSGGETGARFGPSLMPGGSAEAWQSLRPIWEAIAAKVDADTGRPLEDAAPGRPVVGGVPCTAFIGPNGAGHYVKMVHNGIEYGDMQMICEAYFALKNLLGLSAGELSEIFGQWNEGDLDSYLIQITTEILAQKDPADKKGKRFLVDVILDTAEQKGTGKWTSTSALDQGVPAPTIAEAVFARCLSGLKDQRVAASQKIKAPKFKYKGGRKKLINAVRDALYCSKICSYAQGFQLIAEAQKTYNWELNFGEIAMIWRGGCIIRARFLQKIKEAYDHNPKLANLLLDPYFKKQVVKAEKNWRKVVALAAEAGIWAPAFMASLSYFDGYRSAVLPANLLQGQRDFFGAHTYQRTDQPRGQYFHVDWPEPGRPEIAV